MKDLYRIMFVGLGLALLADGVLADDRPEVWQRVATADWDTAFVLRGYTLPTTPAIEVAAVTVWLPDAIQDEEREQAVAEVTTAFDLGFTPITHTWTEGPRLIVQPIVVDLRTLSDASRVASRYRFPARAGGMTLLVTLVDADTGKPVMRLARAADRVDGADLVALTNAWGRNLQAAAIF